MSTNTDNGSTLKEGQIAALINDASVAVKYIYDGTEIEKEISLEGFVKTLRSVIKGVK